MTTEFWVLMFILASLGSFTMGYGVHDDDSVFTFGIGIILFGIVCITIVTVLIRY